MYIKLFALLALVILFSGCATIIKGPTSRVHVYAPDGTQAFDSVGNQYTLKGEDYNHHSFVLSSKKTQYLNFVYRGREKSVVLRPKLQLGWVFLDAIWFGIPAIIDKQTKCWEGLDDVELVYLPPDSVIRKEVDFKDELNKSRLFCDSDYNAQAIKDFYRPRASFITKYAATTTGWLLSTCTWSIFEILGTALSSASSNGTVNKKIDLEWALIANAIFGPICVKAGLSLVTSKNNEHGSYWAAVAGCYSGSQLTPIFLFINMNKSKSEINFSENYLFLAAYALIPPLFSVIFYNQSLPDLYFIPYGEQNSSSLINYNSGNSSFRVLPPSFSIERNPFFPNEYIQKLNVLSIKL